MPCFLWLPSQIPARRNDVYVIAGSSHFPQSIHARPVSLCIDMAGNSGMIRLLFGVVEDALKT
jgi:hypothetical protein